MAHPKTPPLVFSCEHATSAIPKPYTPLFTNPAARAALATHRGVDFGAAAVARGLARTFAAPVHLGEASRLLVDLNRSAGHPRLFSEWTRPLTRPARDEIVDAHWRPYRDEVEAALEGRLSRHGRVLHLSIHSFTPRLKGETRRAELGLLYDPRRPAERTLAAAWQRTLGAAAPELRVRKNYPYTGIQDGFVPALRKSFGPRYIGLELEMNQGFFLDGDAARAFGQGPWLTAVLRRSLTELFAGWRSRWRLP